MVKGTSWSDDDDAGEASAAPPGFGPIPSAKSGDGATTTETPPRFHSIPSRSDDGADLMEPPPGFGPIPTAITEGLEYARQLRSFKAVYCGPKCRSAHHHADVDACFCFYMSIKEQSMSFGTTCSLLVFCPDLMLYYAAVAAFHCTNSVLPCNDVGRIIAFSTVVCAFGDSSHQSHVLHQLHMC